MQRIFSRIRPFLAIGLVVASAASWSQSYPAKPITLIVPNPPGGVVDTAARLAADPLGRILGQPVVVDNRGGASGNIAYNQVARAPKDGYTLLASYSAYHVGNPSLFRNLSWSQQDLVPVGLIVAATNVIAVHPSQPSGSLTDFIAHLRANPGQINYASQGSGSLSHVGTILFAQATDTEITHIPYSGSGAAIQDVLSGQVQMFMTTPPSVLGHVKTNKLNALAVTSQRRHAMLPDVPTTAEAGLPGFELEAWVGLFAPAGTPPDVINRLSQALQEALATEEVKARAELQGVEPRFLGPEALAELVTRDTAYWADVIRTHKISMD